jgi:hypothetical protein
MRQLTQEQVRIAGAWLHLTERGHLHLVAWWFVFDVWMATGAMTTPDQGRATPRIRSGPTRSEAVSSF